MATNDRSVNRGTVGHATTGGLTLAWADAPLGLRSAPFGEHVGSGTLRDVVLEATSGDPSFLLISEDADTRAWSAGATVRPPIAERGAVGMGLGLALAGRRVLVTVAGPGRLGAVAEVLAEASAIADLDEFAVPLVVHVAHGREAGPREDQPLYVVWPGVRLWFPYDAATTAHAARVGLSGRRPCVVFEPRAGGPVDVPERDGRHVVLVAFGSAVAAAAEASQVLSAEGIDAAVVIAPSLPVDVASIAERVRGCGRFVVVHPDEPMLAAGVREALTEACFLYLESPPATAKGHLDDVVRAARAAVHY